MERHRLAGAAVPGVGGLDKFGPDVAYRASLADRHAGGAERLEGAEPLALGLELVILGGFVASLGNNLGPVLMTVRGSLLIFGTLLLAVLLPLLLHLHVGRRFAWGIPAAAVCRAARRFHPPLRGADDQRRTARRGPEAANTYPPAIRVWTCRRNQTAGLP